MLPVSFADLAEPTSAVRCCCARFVVDAAKALMEELVAGPGCGVTRSAARGGGRVASSGRASCTEYSFSYRSCGGSTRCPGSQGSCSACFVG